MPRFTLLKKNRSSEERSAEREIFRHRLKKIIRIVALAAVLIFVIWLLHRMYRNITFTDYDILSKEMRQDADTSQYIAYNGHILKLSRDGAEAFEGNGKAIWNVTYEMQEPHAATCEDYVVLADEQGTELLVASSSEDMHRISTKLPILDFCVSRQGVVAAVLGDGNISWIRLYDKEGEELASIKCTMSESGYPMDISLSPSGYLLAVSYVRVEGEDMRSSVAFYNFGEVGANESDHYMSGYDFTNTFIPRVKFLNDSTAFAMGTDKMAIFSGSQKPEKSYEYGFDSRVRSLFYSEDRIVLIRESALTGGYTASVFNISGEELISIPFDLDYIDAQVTKNRLIIYSDTHMLVYDMKGIVKYDGPFDESTILVSATDDPRKYILVNRETVKQIRLVR
jgi:hypothetical protein